MKEEPLNFEQKLMLEEYKKAQDSAEHHDNIAWLMSSIFIVISIYLLGTLIIDLNNISSILILFGSIIGFLMVIVNGIIFNNAQRIKKRKYSLCKEIENKFNLILQEKGLWQKHQLKNHSSTWGGYNHFYFGLLIIISSSFFVLIVLMIQKIIS